MPRHKGTVSLLRDRKPTISVSLDGPLKILTAREHEVLLQYLKTLNDKKVARELGTRPQTVRNQLASIQHKLGISGRAELVALLFSRANATGNE